jgi:hypothetical protein
MLTRNSMTSRMLWIITMVILSLSHGIAAMAAVIAPKDIPDLAQWNSNMVTFGKQYCGPLLSGAAAMDDTNFDAARVYYQVASHTNLSDWAACANQAAVLYRDKLVVPTGGSLNGAGEWVFSLGLKKHYIRMTEQVSKDAVLLLADKSPWADSTVPLTMTQPYDMSREVALALMAYLDSMELDQARPAPAKFDGFVNQSLGYIDQWYVQRLWEQVGSPAPHFPFMVAFTMQALIQTYSYQQAHGLPGDGRIRDKIKVALDGLWDTAWVASEEAFNLYNWYEQQSGQPDATYNLLIAPAYAWYYLETGDVLYRDRADLVFGGGVRRAVFESAWQFNVNYMWSFDYVAWRQAANDKYSVPPPSPTPSPSTNAAPVCKDAKAIPSILWPPNHRLVPVRIAGVTDPDRDAISIGINLPIRQNEVERGRGRRDLNPDSVAQPDGTLYLRAERSRHGDGRVYEIQFEAQDGKGGTCTGMVKVTVPHQKSKLERFDDDDDDRDHDGDKHDHRKDGDRHGDKDKGKDKDKHRDGDKRGR